LEVPLLKIFRSYHPYAFTAIFCWSLAYVFTRLALAHFSPLSLGFLRCLIASCILGAVGFRTGMKLPRREDLKYFAAAGAAGFFLYLGFFNQGSLTVTSATSSIIISSAPVITALLAVLFQGERVGMLQWAAIAVEFCGILVLSLMKGALTVNRGILWLLLAALVLSVYNLLQKGLTKKYSGLQTAAYSIMGGTAMLAVFASRSFIELASAPPSQLFNLAMLSVFSSAIAYVAWSKAFEKAGNTSSVSNYMFVTPLLSSLLGFLIAGESPDSATLIGGAVILSGLALFNLGRRYHHGVPAAREE
jgi:drug/metabolite transporter (DMT)-like permease